MEEKIIEWLLKDDNPAILYRTKTEILNEKYDKSKVIDYIIKFLPKDWQETKGLWNTYYLTAIAECGITKDDIEINDDKLFDFGKYLFGCSCGCFMRLRALIKLGFLNEQKMGMILNELEKKQLPDGGFLCLHRVDKLNYIPKSCFKANMHALMFLAECKKRKKDIDITEKLLEYFWNHKIFYRTSDLSKLILDAREGWRTIDTFYPFEVMRVGLQNIIEAFCALGYGKDERLKDAWDILESKKNDKKQIILNGTLTKSYLPKESVGKPSKWVTFYTLLAEKEKGE